MRRSEPDSTSGDSKNWRFVPFRDLTPLWILVVGLVNPVGDFPLNDDWAYGYTVRTWLETGTYRLSDWTAASLLPQAMWGTAFCAPFGFSFTALRFSTLVLGWIGALATYGVLRETGARRPIALLGALTLFVNPLYVAMAHSYNTDVPSLATAMAALYFFSRALRTASPASLAAGIALGVVTTLNRQSGIAVLVAFGAAWLVRHGLRLRHGLLATLPAAAALLLGTLYTRALEAGGPLPVLYGFQIRRLLGTLSSGIAHVLETYARNGTTIAVYCGLFLLPFTIPLLPGAVRRLGPAARRVAVAAAGLALAAGALFVLRGNALPLAGNVLGSFGIGPQTIPGSETHLDAAGFRAAGRIWTLLTVLGVAGAAGLVAFLPAIVREGTASLHTPARLRASLLTLHLTVLVLYTGAIAGLDKSSWFDRYLVFFLPLGTAILSIAAGEEGDARRPRRLLPVAFALAAAMGLASVALTHDYLAWNRARWEALRALMRDEGIPAARIDGGFEFNGWHFGNRFETCAPDSPKRGRPEAIDGDDFLCLWAEGRRNAPYAVGFVPEPGAGVVRETPFRRWLPPRKDRVVVFRRPYQPSMSLAPEIRNEEKSVASP